MNFGESREITDVVRKYYTGVENFKVVSVNPTLSQLKILYGDNVDKEEEYSFTMSDGKKLNKIVFHLDNQEEDDSLPKIKTRLTLLLSPEHPTSSQGKKQVINAFGQTAWLTDDELNSYIGATSIDIGGKGTYLYDTSEMRVAYKGEEKLISILRNLLNLTNPKSDMNIQDKGNCMSYFSKEEILKIISGDVASLNKIITNSNNKIGVLLGVKQVEDKLYQDSFDTVLRQFVKNSNNNNKYDYFTKDFDNAINAGRYTSTNFGNRDFVLREYKPNVSFAQNEELFISQPSVTDIENLFA